MSKALPPDLATDYGSRMGVDLSDVRVHTGPEAAARNDALDARAFAEGTDVQFGEGEYDPESTEGRELLAHELVHVAQAKQGASGVMTKRADGSSSGDHEHEADRGAHALVHGAGPVAVAAAPAAIMRKPADKPKAGKKASAADIRRDILECSHEMMQVKSETISQDHKAQDDGEKVAGASSGRAVYAITHIMFRLGAIQEDMKALGAEDKKTLVPLAEGLLFQTGALYSGREVALGPLIDGVKKLLTDSLGELHPANALAAYRKDSTLGESKADRSAEAPHLLDAAIADIGAAIKPGEKDLVGGAGIGHLEALYQVVTYMNHNGEHAEVMKLSPKVKVLMTDARSAKAIFDKSPRVRELYARINVIAEATELPPLSDDKVDKMLDDERTGQRGYTDAQMAAFEAAGQLMQVGLQDMYERRIEGVNLAYQESEAKEKPPSTFLKDLVIGALSAATGGIAGALVGKLGEMVAAKVLGGVAEAAEKAIAKHISDEVGKVVKTAIEKAPEEIFKHAADKIIDYTADKLKEPAEGKETEGKEDAPSTNSKLAFFQAQRDGLHEAKKGAQASAIKMQQQLRSQFSTAPTASTLALSGYSEKLGDSKGEASPVAIQATATGAKWAAYLNEEDVSDRTAGGGVDMSGEIDGKSELVGAHYGYDKDGYGMIGGHVDIHSYSKGEVTVSLNPLTMLPVAAWVKGLGPDLRGRLHKAALAPLGVPMRAVLDSTATKTRMARNGEGEIFTHSDEVGTQLLARFNPDKGERDPERAKEKAAKFILEDVIGNKPLPVPLNNTEDGMVIK